MSYNKYNDNELLYLISLNNEDALEVLIKKYYPLIKNRINKFNIKEYNKDDFFQECLITFFQVLRKFRDDKNGIFTLYLDKAVQEKIRRILKKEKNYFYNVTIIENLDDVPEEKVISQNDNLYESIDFILSNFEFCVYEKYYINNESPKKISCDILCEEKKVYNAIDRIKRKINNKNKNRTIDGKNVHLLKLSKLEKEVYEYYKKGYNPNEIVLILKYDYRKVLNALSRVKYKMKK